MDDDLERFDRTVANAVREMAEEPTIAATVERAVEMVTESMQACDMAGISVIEDGKIRTVAATTEVLRQVDQWQFELHEGPCYDALREHEVVTANDLATDERWPVYGPRLAEEAGIRASVSYRLFTTGDSLGALNIYATEPDRFGHEDVAEGQALAAHVAAAVASALKEHQLHVALGTRTTIGQTTGILIERYGLTPQAAFGVLRRISQVRSLIPRRRPSRRTIGVNSLSAAIAVIASSSRSRRALDGEHRVVAGLIGQLQRRGVEPLAAQPGVVGAGSGMARTVTGCGRW